MAKVMGAGDPGVAVPPPQAAITTPLTRISTTFLTPGRVRQRRLDSSTHLSYAGARALSPPVDRGCHPYKRMGSGGAGTSLQLDQALVSGRDYRLQLGVDLQLLDHVTDVPLHGVGGDGKTL